MSPVTRRRLVFPIFVCVGMAKNCRTAKTEAQSEAAWGQVSGFWMGKRQRPLRKSANSQIQNPENCPHCLQPCSYDELMVLRVNRVALQSHVNQPQCFVL